MTLGPYSRLTFLEVTQRLPGPSWVALSWAFSRHVTCLPLGLRQMVLMGSFLICHSFGKKVGIYISPPSPCLKVYSHEAWVSVRGKHAHIAFDSVVFFFFESWCSYFEGSGGCVGYYLFTLLLVISYCLFLFISFQILS